MIEDLIMGNLDIISSDVLEKIIKKDLNFVSNFNEQAKMFPNNLDIHQLIEWYDEIFKSK